jgi:hypothetical protein
VTGVRDTEIRWRPGGAELTARGLRGAREVLDSLRA